MIYQRKGTELANGVLSDFEIVSMIGKGQLSNVFLVSNKKNEKPYAMKSIRRSLVNEKELEENIKIEKEVLEKVNLWINS